MMEVLGLDSAPIVTLIVTFLPIIYWFLTKNFKFWQKQGIPGPKPIIIFGNFLDRVKRSMIENDNDYVKKFGKFVGYFNGTDPVLQVSDPKLIKVILIKEFDRFHNRRELRSFHPVINTNLFNARDEHWKKVRTITSSTFTSGKMRKMYGLVDRCVKQYLRCLDKVAESGQPLNAKRAHECLTMDVIACCAFATQTNAIEDPNNEFIRHFRKLFDTKASKFIPEFVFPKTLNRLLNHKSAFNDEANEYMIELARQIMTRRKQNGENNSDFLQLLMDAKAEEQDKSNGNFFLDEDTKSMSEWNSKFANKTLTEDEILGQCWVFMVAGFDTTATTLGCMSYELAINPECQQRLYDELMAAMTPNGEIGYEELHQLPYLDACVNETLRLYPAAPRLEREANSDFDLEDSGIKINKGMVVEIPVYAIHLSEEYFPNADQFNPDRFMPENRHLILPYTYLPFGTGPRICIGMRFALMEVKLAMAHIITRFRFTKIQQTEKKIKFRPISPLLDPLSITLGIEKR